MRERLTWKRGGANNAPARRASAHPAYPDEGPANPAYQPDPEADAYENGDPSSWAEDPHPGPYPQSAHPAYPDEGPASPAYTAKKGSVGLAIDRKAAKCVRLASALLGPNASEHALENQALAFMDLSDRVLHASLSRLAQQEEEEVEEEVEEDESESMKGKKATQRRLAQQEEDEEDEAEEQQEKGAKKAALAKAAYLRRLAQQIEEEVEEDEEDEAEEQQEKGAKKASALEARLDRIERLLTAGIPGMFMQHEEQQAEDEVEVESLEEMLLEEMLHEEMQHEAQQAPAPHASPEAQQAEAQLAEMLQEEGMGGVLGAEYQDEAEAMLMEEVPMADAGMGMGDGAMSDPMGLMGDMNDDDAILASLFSGGMKYAKQDEAEEQQDEAEEQQEKGAKKKASASLRPQPRKASTGATRLGGVTKEAAEVNDLSNLWESAPDVSKYFG
jgi:hypothetical protein